jgi:NitT/TauT family transport system permease protein
MANPFPAGAPLPPADSKRRDRPARRSFPDLFGLRKEIPLWQEVVCGILCIAVCLGLWWYVTRDRPAGRLINYYSLQSPQETFGEFPSLWKERDLVGNTLATLQRVVLGFGLAALVGAPLGVLCGCFPRVNAFFLPLMIFGRNIPIAALIPLMFALFKIGETEKVMFLFVACVAFVVADTGRAVMEVGSPYIDTAYTLGASRWQVIMKVLVPLALPSVFNSLRLLFGLAFGYIMLAELVKFPGQAGGLGDLIFVSQEKGPREHILLILLIIPLIALAIDRMLFWVQKELFPHRYGGSGILNDWVSGLLHLWDDFKCWVRRPAAAPGLPAPPGDGPDGGKP